MRMSELQVQQQAEEEKLLQAKAGPSVMTTVTPSETERIHALRGGGHPLPTSVRRFFEPRFGHDFQHIRLHTDAAATRLSGTLGAEAFTYGRDIFIGHGRFAPGTLDGQHLLAHELTHVVQANRSSDVIRRKVVDNDFHVPCRKTRTNAVNTLIKDEAEAIRICTATAGRIEAHLAGTDPDPAGFLDALRRRFHLDGTDPGVRAQWLPLLAKRYRIVANAIKKHNRRYNCAAEGSEPAGDCTTRSEEGMAFTGGGSGETDLCDEYWGHTDPFRGGVIAHEWFHSIFEWFGDCGITNTDSAECYEMFARELAGTAGATDLIECCVPPSQPTPPATVPPQPPVVPLTPPVPSLPFVPFFF